MVLPCTEMSPRWDLKFEWGLNLEYVRYEINFSLFHRIVHWQQTQLKCTSVQKCSPCPDNSVKQKKKFWYTTE